MKRINFIGEISGCSGYSAHSRSLVNALYKQHQDIHLKTVMTQETMQTFNDAEMKMVKTPFDPEGLTVAIGMPHYWNTLMADGVKNFVGFLVWEGSNCPEFWLDYIADPRVKQIWTPSLHTKQALLNTIKMYREKHNIK